VVDLVAMNPMQDANLLPGLKQGLLLLWMQGLVPNSMQARIQWPWI